jgi:hypothetical protein
VKTLFRTLILFLTGITLESLALASHFKGGELVYTYLGSGRYKIVANSYWTSGCGMSFTHSASSSLTIVSAMTQSGNTTTNGTQECIHEETIQYNGTSVVEDVISYSSNARVSGGSNFSASAFGFSTKIIYDPNDDTKNSSSPSFGSKPFYTFSSTAGSTSFSLNASLPSGPFDRVWAYRKFSLSNPVGVSNPYQNMTGLSINALNGTVTWTTPTTGLWLVAVKIEQTDANGTVLGPYIFRDFMITVANTTNQPPTISSITSSALMGTSLNTYTLSVSASDPDLDDVTLTVSGVPFSNGATFQQTTTGSSVTGTVTWTTPITGLYAVQFTATDNSSYRLFGQRDVTIGIDVPLASNASLSLNAANAPLTGTLTAVDPASLALTYSIYTQPTQGTVTITDASAGSFSYTPTLSSYSGTDVFSFRAYNGTVYSNSGTVTIALTGVANSSPTLGTNAGLGLAAGTSAVIGSSKLQVTDTEQGAASLTYTLTLPPANGTLYKNGTALASNATFTQSDIDNSLISYQHSTATRGDSFTFTVADGSGGTIAATNFVITITGSPVVPESLALQERVSCLLLSSGALSCWGDGTQSKIPHPTSAYSTLVSAPTPSFQIEGIQQLSTGRRHGCFLKADGSIACFGEGSAGQLGDGGNAADSNGFVTVSGFGN